MKDILINDFLDAMAAEHGVSSNTLDAYSHDLEQFFDICPQQPAKITQTDIEVFIRNLRQQGLVASTIMRKISALNDFFKFLLTEQEISCNPMVGISTPRRGHYLPNFLTRDEVRLMLEAAEEQNDVRHKRTATMLKLMYACGMRVSELVELPVNCINFDRKQILIKGKGKKERIVPIAQEAIDSVFDWLKIRPKTIGGKESKFMFPSNISSCGHITRDAFFKNVKKLAILSGLDETKISPHTLRHSFATHLLSSDVDLRSIQSMLGHENIGTTEIYTHILTDKLTKEIITKHPLARLKN